AARGTVAHVDVPVAAPDACAIASSLRFCATNVGTEPAPAASARDDVRVEATSTMSRSLILSVRIPLAALALFLASPSRPAAAGWGGARAPPAPGAVRPNATYAGMPVSLFSSTFTVGTAYTVVFASITGATASVNTTVVSRRDVADATYKPQIVVNL